MTNFSSSIKQLKLNDVDNYNKNEQAHIDLSNEHDNLLNLLSSNHNIGNYITKPIEFENSKLSLRSENSLIYKHGVIESNRFGLDSLFDYENHIYLLKTGTIIGSNSLFKHCPYYVLQPNNDIFLLNNTTENIPHYYSDFIDRNGFELKNCTTSLEQYNSDLTSGTIPTYEISQSHSCNQSITLRFSVESIDDENIIEDNGVAFVGLGLINQPLLTDNTDFNDIGILKPQTDGIACMMNFNINNVGNSVNNVFPSVSGKLSVKSATMDFGRVSNNNTRNGYPNGEYYYFYHTNNLNNDIQWQWNNNIPKTFSDNLYTSINLDGNSNYHETFFYQGCQINEIKIEVGKCKLFEGLSNERRYTIFIIYLNGHNVGMMKTYTEKNNFGISTSYFNINNLIPVIFCKAPKSMIKIHSLSFDML